MQDYVDYFVFLYVVSKKSNELMVYIYSYFFGLFIMGLWFFMVYGFWGCFDMVIFFFIKVILND